MPRTRAIRMLSPNMSHLYHPLQGPQNIIEKRKNIEENVVFRVWYHSDITDLIEVLITVTRLKQI